ncbi:flagellar assembly peptidoglycan hydrolase FlgJ [Chromobacterium subtsugae]|uniref:Flagellar assembly peptidoglycan hydrolase FlgJ n=1 Tax=Chromobacterium subtsugae TaxID=251747 RepID=A0ABS7FBP2_9NEIS|nr:MULTISPECIES: flagellar assembly peptidoglycan hydrolase FlgJ [Chromobacterium]KUM02997.1 flagellar biosynthesis protein FlgJ [Chromobacterium subtsugae]KZE85956.1 flagellar biosynthesis protein FlgJ [Chromobacterium sp. F49]MBW7567329.1 flagellar assembly peptidoglycan hydrolase FlgJ [Chromobacterium subtsugae]MBW8287495.1 flagellar assembly peptidoglycan hydrolase FlgJ [Chromobacterium subtsugae]WSE93453.1 flagellar assembly peptidoglycan hydrolase FlgJ [Chromobacterium subtsugae]
MFTQRSEAGLGAAFAQAADGVALPLALPAPGAGFAEQLAGVRGEVERFIADGDAAAPTALSPEAWRVQQQMKAGQAMPTVPTVPPDRQAFVAELAPYAREAADRLGVAPDILVAHAALESGWGRKPLRRADGGDSHNLFGIKADSRWRGEVAASLTTEYLGGKRQSRVEPFRAYPDYRAAFADYADLLATNPRYRAALGVGSDARAFAGALARGGYATDPDYAGKLAGLVGRLRGESL